MKTWIKQGKVIDPSTNREEICDILIEDGNIKLLESQGLSNQEEIGEDTRIIDAKGYWVIPGLMDLHVHLREPGFEYKETIATGSQAAAKGGFTTICCMPNTKPVIDNEVIVEYIKLKAEKEACVHVLPIGSITKNQDGEELANIGFMAEAGICAISEDGKSVEDAGLMKKAMTYGKMFNLPIFAHCEDPKLAGSGVMHAGEMAAILGMKGIPKEAEDVMVARDILLAESTGAHLHICHISTKGSVDLLRYAKEKNISVTAEVCPHHFTLTEAAVDGYDTNTKMSPPLRGQEDVEAIKEALRDGIIEVIATDHAPHHYDEKNCEYEKAANGIVGLETAVPLGITELVETGILTPMEWVATMTTNPAKILNSPKGTLQVGKMADITIIDPKAEYEIDVTQFASKSKNSPFHGRKVRGKVLYTMVEGKIVVAEGELV